MTLPKWPIATWISIVTVTILVAGYIQHLESVQSDNAKEHDETIRQRESSRRQRDSIINAMAIQNVLIKELQRDLHDKIARDNSQEDIEENRMDQIEKDELVDRTEFHDYIKYKK